MGAPDFLTDEEMAALSGGGQPDFLTDEQMASLSKPTELQAMPINLGRSALQGLFGLGDEAVAAMDATLGLSQGDSWSDRYSSRLDLERAQNKAFYQEHPYLAGGTELLTGFGSTIAAPVGVAAQSARFLPAVAKAVAGGALGGAAYGFGSGEGEQDRLEKMALAGALGGASAGTLTAGGRVIGATARRAMENPKIAMMVANAGDKIDDLTSFGRREAGAIVLKGGDIADDEAVDPIVQALLKTTKEVNPEDVTTAVSKLESAQKRGVPMNLVDALSNPQVDVDARYYRNTRGGRTVAEDVLTQRARGVEGRALSQLSDISPESSTLDGAQRMALQARNIVEKAKKDRTRISSPFYTDASEAIPIINDRRVGDALKSKTVRGIVKNLREEFPNEFSEEIADNSFIMLDQIKQGLDAKISQAVNNQDSGRVRLLTNLKKDIVNAVDEAGPEYRAARKVYERLTPEIEHLAGSRQNRVKGVLSSLLDADPGNYMNGVKKLMTLEPGDIAKVKNAFGPDNIDEFNAGIRAYLQDQLEQVRFGVSKDKNINIADRLMGTTKQVERLKAALGTKKVGMLKRFLEEEAQMQRTSQKTFTGSSTQTNIETAKEVSSFLSKLLASPFKSTAQYVKESFVKPDEALNRQIAEALFDPSQALIYGQKLAPIKTKIGRYQDLVEAALTNENLARLPRGSITGAGMTSELE